MRRPFAARFGAHPVGIWTIKHLVSPLDRLVVRFSGGRIPPPSSIALPTVQLTVVGRRSGEEHTVPLVYVGDGEDYVVGNARPAGERRNPWIANLRATGRARIRDRNRTFTVDARELTETETERWWPALTDVWPAFAKHYADTGERTMFILEPAKGGVDETEPEVEDEGMPAPVAHVDRGDRTRRL